MQVRVNGQPVEVPDGCTVALLLERVLHQQAGFAGQVAARVAVERNQDIVPRATWSAAQLADGDQIEIVTFVGGG